MGETADLFNSAKKVSQTQASVQRKDEWSQSKTFSFPGTALVPKPVKNVRVKVDVTKLRKALKELG